MISIHPTRGLVTLMAIAGVLAVAGPAGASSADPRAGASGIVTDNKDPDRLVLMADMGGQYWQARVDRGPAG